MIDGCGTGPAFAALAGLGCRLLSRCSSWTSTVIAVSGVWQTPSQFNEAYCH
jgi:hypothetical protein